MPDRLQAQVYSNNVIRLPREVRGSITISQGMENIKFIGHPLGTTWTAGTRACVTIVGGDANTMPPQADDAYELTNISAGFLEYDGGKGSSLSEGDYVWIYPVDGGGNPIEEVTANNRLIGGFATVITNVTSTHADYDKSLANVSRSEYASDYSTGQDLSDTGTWDEYFTELTWKVYKINVIPARNISFENITFQGTYITGDTLASNYPGTLIGAFYCNGLTIKNCSFKNVWAQHLYIARCSEVFINNITQQSCGHHAAGSGYSCELTQCTRSIADGVYAERVGRVVTVDGSGYGIIIKNVKGWNLRGGIVDWHGGLGFGMKWFHIQQMNKPNMTFADQLISLGNGTHEGPLRGVTVLGCIATEFQVFHDGEAHFYDSSFYHIHAVGTGGIMSFARYIKVCSGVHLDSAILIANSPPGGNFTTLENAGPFLDPGYWGSAFVRGTDTGSAPITLSIFSSVIHRNIQTVPHCSFAGTGTLTTQIQSSQFLGGTGTRVIVSAPAMTDGGGTWSDVTVNGVAVTKSAAQIAL